MASENNPFDMSEEAAKTLFEPVVRKAIEVLTGSKKARLNIVPYLVNVGVNTRQDAIGYTVELEILDGS